jgi:4-diphosphocytidyl-2-C-methyl-D-erythritol kinase
LDVIKKREDGFHDIRTIFSEIDLYDELFFDLTKKGSIEILTDTDQIELHENLIYQLAFFIKDTYDVKDGCRIRLKKIIPIAAGLGGGSSNAAATIIALNKLWNLQLSFSTMQKIAAKFGSDIAFFLTGGIAIGTGKGDDLTPLDDYDIENIILVNPGFKISSKEAYQMIEDVNPNEEKWNHFFSTYDCRYAFNKLEEKVSLRYPEIRNEIDRLIALGAYHSILSGSGATIIGFCENEHIAHEISDFYSKKQIWNCITKTKRRTL